MSEIQKYKVGGMSCEGCARSVREALQGVFPECEITVDLAAGQVAVKGSHDEEALAVVVEGTGYDFNGKVRG
ncbi:MAG: heavy-metal-associated domain-containing protein [Myxococcales bacterium]|nr:heavy-metal-associated domain-containing protein [Myxococcales bacterium]